MKPNDAMHAAAGKGLRKKLLVTFFLRLGVFTLAYGAALVLCLFVLKYTIANFLYNRFPSNIYFGLVGFWQVFAVIGFLLGIAFITFLTVNRATGYLDALYQSIGVLLKQDESLVQLPEELQEAEQQLNALKVSAMTHAQHAKEAEQRKNDLVVYLAHDMKTPLTSVIGYLSLLEEAPDMPLEQRAKYTGIALEKAYRLETLIDEFFDITRFNLQTIVLEPEEIHLDLLLHQLADEFYPILAPQGKAARVACPEGLTLWADPDKLARVFHNILKNAAAYSYPDRLIEIEAREDAAQVVVSFTNVGRTIPKEKLDRIFEKFYRLDSARSTNTGGAGLGLAIAKEIVLAHGGAIAASSENERTVFTVTLPKK